MSYVLLSTQQLLTKLDGFATAAMQGLLAKHGGHTEDSSDPLYAQCLSEKAMNVNVLADYAYEQAQAMVRARNRLEEVLNKRPYQSI